MKEMVIAGHICLDIFPAFPPGQEDFLDRFMPGKLFDMGPIRFFTGGTVSNTGLASVRFGMPTVLMGLVGDDVFGREILNVIRAHGGDAGGIQIRSGVTTSYTIVLAPPGVDRIFFHHPGSNDLFDASCIDFARVEKAGLFHFGYPPLMKSMFENHGEELIRIYRRARQTGVVTSLDMALPDPASPAGLADWKRILTELLPLVDLFLPSIEELLYMLDRPLFLKRRREAGTRNLVDVITPEDVSSAAGRALALGAGAVLIKCGHRGLYLRTASENRLAPARQRLGLPADWADRELWQPCLHVPRVAGTTGAGDSAIAGFLSACARGQSPESALRYASAAGSFNVTQPDSLSGLVSWEEMTRAISAGWEADPLHVEAPDWQFDKDRGQWRGPADSAKN
jgi:sugar/nucleoside kinase (ribokinase family)